MTTIYLIGTTSDGVARTQSETMARALNTCPICGTPMVWEDCDVCGGEGHIDACDLNPLWYNLSNVKMLCNLCDGHGGWWTCPNYHNHPTEIHRTASDPAGTTPARPPATPLAGRQRARQQKHPL